MSVTIFTMETLLDSITEQQSLEEFHTTFPPVEITLYFVVVNEKLSCPADCLSLILTKRSLLLGAVHAVSSLSLACVLTSMLGGRYSDLIVECRPDSSQR